MRRSILVALAVASAAVLLGSCADDTAGPRQPLNGRFAVVPNFGALAGGIVEVAEGRFILTRIPGGDVAVDTVIEIPSDADSVDLALAVPVFSPGETFNLTIRLISPSGDTVFAAGPIEVSPTTSGAPVPVDVPFEYVGTGAEAMGIQILSPDTTTFTGEPVLLTAVALDSSEVAIPGTPIGWESLDSAIVQVTADPQFRGLAVGASQRGVARLVATLVTGQTDTVLVTNQPLPTALVAESGGGQSARADSLLPLPLVARVTAADGLGVSGLWVRFAVTSGGGIVSSDSVLTDATGRASVSFTLARSFAPHVVTATTPRLGAASAVFNATLVFEPPATLEIMTGDGQAAVAGTAVSTAPQVRVLDANGLPVPGMTVTFSVTGGAGVVTGGTPVTDTLGLAAVTSWTLGTTAGPNALQAEVSTLTATFTATGIAGSATQLALVSGDGQTGNVGQALSLPLVVRAADANGNGVAGATVDWNAGQGTLSAAATATDTAGLARVTWTLGTTPGSQSATASLSGTAATVGFTATATAAGPGINTWIVTSGLWSTDTNWSLGRAPIPGDTVQLTQGVDYQVTLDVSPTIAKLAIGGTTDVISLNVGDQTLAITDAGSDPGLDILPLGSLVVGNGSIVAERISNQGSVRFTGTSASLATTSVSNANAWRVVGGQLTVTGEAFDFRTSGLLRMENGATLTFDGNGFLTYLGGTITAGLGTSNVLAFVNGAELGLQADLAFDSLTISLNDGRIQGFLTTERLTIGPDGGLILSGGILAEVQARVVNQGALLAMGGTSNFLNDSLYNEDGAIVIVDGTSTVTRLTANGIDNSGTMNLAGANQTTLQVTGGGGLTIRSTGAVATQAGATRTLDATLFNEGGTLSVGGPTEITRAGAQHVNGPSGVIDLAGGSLAFVQSGTTPTLVNAGAIFVGPATILSVSGGTFTNAGGGTLMGQGTVDVSGTTFTNAGTLAPGQSPGLLTWQGNIGMAVTAQLAIELGGTTVATEYDRLDAGGSSVTLGGALDVTLINGFTPAVGDRFAIMTFAGRTNQFANVTLPPVDGLVLDTLWAIDADPIDTLYIVANAPPAPKVLFAGDSAGISLNSGIFSVNPDGSNQFQITTEGPPGETNVHPRWSPDRSRITYSARSLRADPNQLHVRTADGSVVRHLTSTTDTSTFKPRYSPDGVHLAFECGNGGYPTTPQDVCVIADVRNPSDGMGDGTGKVYVTDAVDATLGGSGTFAWNPQNPDQLAVVRDSVFIGPTAIVGSVIWLVKFDGSGAAPLGTKVILDGAGAPVQVYSMDWAPDGSFIAFEGTSGGTRSIFRIEVATGAVTQLTSQNVDFGPVVSPDATEILFGRQNDLWTLMKIPATGGNVLQMSDYMNFAPAQAGWDWSPDGTEIAVTEDATTGGVVISKIRRETTATSFFSDALAGKLGRRGSFEIQDRQPSWRP